MAGAIKNFFHDLFLPKTLNVHYDSGYSDKKTIVLLHGIAASSKTWDYFVDQIDKEKYRVITMDLLGFGISPKPNNCNYDVSSHIDYIRRTIKKLNIKTPFILVGHSMGSIISARYASLFSDEVSDLFLLSLPIYYKEKNIQSFFSIGRTDLFLKIYDFVIKNKDLTIKASHAVRNLIGVSDGMEVTDITWNSFRLSLKNTIINQNTYDDIAGLRMPVKILYGSNDKLLIDENIQKLSKFENIKITKLDSVDHFVSEKFTKELIDQINN